MDVRDVHMLVMHVETWSLMVGVGSSELKSLPASVIIAPPLIGPFVTAAAVRLGSACTMFHHFTHSQSLRTCVSDNEALGENGDGHWPRSSHLVSLVLRVRPKR